MTAKLERLAIGAGLFFIFLVATQKITAASSKNLTSTVQAESLFSGDFVGRYEFSGPLGTVLTGQAEKPDKSGCEPRALFRRVRQQSKNQIEVFFHFVCSSKGQTSDKKITLSPPRFFIDEKTSTHNSEFLNLSSEFQKIQVRWTLTTSRPSP